MKQTSSETRLLQPLLANLNRRISVVRVRYGSRAANRDDMPYTVSACSRADDFASDPIDTGETFAYRFARVGRFSYFCGLHPQMQGVVTVR